MKGTKRVIIENVKPEINCGLFPIKRVVNELVPVEADIFCDGHDQISAEIVYKKEKDKDWQVSALKHDINDLWHGSFKVTEQEDYVYTVRAWVDLFKTWFGDIEKRIEAQTDYEVDLLIGLEYIDKVLNSKQPIAKGDKERLQEIRLLIADDSRPLKERIEPVTSKELYEIMIKYPDRQNLEYYEKDLHIMVERERAAFSSWYETFPRSTSDHKNQYGTLRDTAARIPYIADMGFDVLYLPPIHPIGNTKRKGKNNSLKATEEDPGSPWAIGNKEGGHKSIHPELGTMEDFHLLVDQAHEHNIEIALDVAFQCSPDHPYVKENPQWFKKRPDGSIQYAENPPKKYEDIYPFNFESEDWENMWNELMSIFTFWIDKGVKIFRVDNPHTKSLNFWGWLIHEIRKDHPDIIFLSEAFTRPKVMYQLAKQGFTQSYTYFTWRNTKWELTTYMEKLINEDVKDYFRPNLWPNTPDILPEYLQVSGKPGFIIRHVLAATLSSNYGIYGPAFELMDNTPKEFGSEEYMNSEKYEIKEWDLASKKSLKPVIRLVNKIRRENPALQRNSNLKFHQVDNEQIICYTKHTDDNSNIILVVVNLDPHHRHSGWMHLPIEDFDIDPHTPYQVHDLLGGAYFLWNGAFNYVELDPGIIPAHIFKIRRKIRTEQDFDYFM